MNDLQKNSIKILCRQYYDYQNQRLAMDGRMGTKKNLEKKKGIPERDDELLEILFVQREDLISREEEIMCGVRDVKTKKLIKKGLKHLVREYPIWKEFLKDIKGCGETMAAVIISEIDIHKADTVSKIWQFAGLNPGMVRGKKFKGKGDNKKIIVSDEMVRGDKKTAGFLCPYNQFLKAKMCGVLGAGFLKAESPYREYYDNMKHRLISADWGMESKNPTDPKRPKAGHQHKAANRYMVKMFIKDLYIAWRTLEGLPVREPYQEEYLKKRHTA